MLLSVCPNCTIICYFVCYSLFVIGNKHSFGHGILIFNKRKPHFFEFHQLLVKITSYPFLGPKLPKSFGAAIKNIINFYKAVGNSVFYFQW